jgi:hypothetical protein
MGEEGEEKKEEEVSVKYDAGRRPGEKKDVDCGC